MFIILKLITKENLGKEHQNIRRAYPIHEEEMNESENEKKKMIKVIHIQVTRAQVTVT